MFLMLFFFIFFLRMRNELIKGWHCRFLSSNQNARVSKDKKGGKDSIETGLDEIFDSFKRMETEIHL